MKEPSYGPEPYASANSAMPAYCSLRQQNYINISWSLCKETFYIFLSVFRIFFDTSYSRPEKTPKPEFRSSWCRQEDSNLHEGTFIRTWTVRVCQFRHACILLLRQQNYISTTKNICKALFSLFYKFFRQSTQFVELRRKIPLDSLPLLRYNIFVMRM